MFRSRGRSLIVGLALVLGASIVPPALVGCSNSEEGSIEIKADKETVQQGILNPGGLQDSKSKDVGKFKMMSPGKKSL